MISIWLREKYKKKGFLTPSSDGVTWDRRIGVKWDTVQFYHFFNLLYFNFYNQYFCKKASEHKIIFMFMIRFECLLNS